METKVRHDLSNETNRFNDLFKKKKAGMKQ